MKEEEKNSTNEMEEGMKEVKIKGGKNDEWNARRNERRKGKEGKKKVFYCISQGDCKGVLWDQPLRKGPA
jgi:hypothetical protein